MGETVLKIVMAGLSFGIWPLLMNKSGLNGNTATAAFSIIVLLIVLPIGLLNGLTLAGSKPWFVLAAGCFAAVGLTTFNSVMAKATPENVGQLFVIMLVVQTAVPAIYQAYTNGGLTIKSAAGFLAALIAAFLLS